MLSDITIIIPTYNRPRQLNRLLNYYSRSKFQIIVGDSSPDIFPYLKRYRNVKYYHYPNFSYAKKLPLIYDRVRTKYVLFCADDDFIIPKSIIECRNFLNKNSDYNSAHGHYIFFEDQKKNLTVYPFYLASIKLDINSNSPSKRVKHLLSHYMQLLYAVTKTSDMKLAFKLLRENPRIKNDNLVELFQAIILCINGKSKTLPNLYCAREITPNSARTHTQELDVYLNQPKHSKEYRAWFDSITKHLSAREKIPLEKAEEIFNEGVMLYLRNFLLYIPFLKISFTNVQRTINKYSLGLVKKVYNFFIPFPGNENLPKHAFSKKRGQKEWEKIRTLILNS